MPTDLRLVAHAAQAHADELAIDRPRNGLPQGGLAHARRADQTQNRPAQLAHPALNREVLEDPFLDRLQTVMVLVELILRPFDVDTCLGPLLPRHAGDGVEIIADHCGLGRHRRHHLQLVELGRGLGLDRLRHTGLFDLVLDLLHLVGRVFHLAEFLLNGLHLLIQVVLALRLFHLLLDAATDALFDLEDVDLALNESDDVLKPSARAIGFEDGLLVFEPQAQMRGDGIREAAGIIHAGEGRQQFSRCFLVELYVLLEQTQRRPHQSIHLARLIVIAFVEWGVLGDEVAAVLLGEVRDPRALRAFDQHLSGAVRELQQLEDTGQRSDLVDIVQSRVIGLGLSLRNQQDLLVIGHRRVQGVHRFVPPHEQGNRHVGVHHHIAQWQDGDLLFF